MKLSYAAKLQMLMELMSPIPIYDDEGNEVGTAPPVLNLTNEEIMRLLDSEE